MTPTRTIFILLLIGIQTNLSAGDYDELQVKRANEFSFTEKPTLHRDGDRYTITFASKAYCDVTVAIEGPQGNIVRHLASGVLGKNAPAPFKKNALKQSLYWDGKDDLGKYVAVPEDHVIRVSLGLKPAFEKSLFWSPKKRISSYPPLIQAAPEGVYVYEGRGVDFVRLFDHQGEYVRTIYPFPATRLSQAKGLKERVFPQDQKKLPVKLGFVQATLLTSGTSSLMGLRYKFGDGFGATAMAVQGKRIALAHLKLNRLSTQGDTGGHTLTGPETAVRLGSGKGASAISPSSAALSPDGKTLYLAGYFFKRPRSYMFTHYCLPVVMKVNVEGDAKEKVEVFAGTPDLKGAGTGDKQFKAATSVAVDAQGRVYVSDYPNDRIQVFDAQGTLLKSIKARRPACVRVDSRNGEIYVFSWMAPTDLVVNEAVQPALTRFGPFANPQQISSTKLPFKAEKLTGYYRGWGLRYSAEIDVHAKQPTVWIVSQRSEVTRETVSNWGAGVLVGQTRDMWNGSGIALLRAEKDSKWTVLRNFASDVKQAVKWTKPAAFSRQRLYVNPAKGDLYIANEQGFGKSFTELVKIDPKSGKTEIVKVPFDSEDLAFDLKNRAYLRTDKLVARFDVDSWREVPWDYGEEQINVGFSSLGAGRRASLISALPTPGQRPVFWHQGGMWVNAKGNLAVCCTSRASPRTKNPGMRFRSVVETAKPYTPSLYPGRARWQEIHIYDQHGKLIVEDAVPGIGISDGLGLGKDNHIYLMAAQARMFGKKRYPNIMSGTVMKFAPRKGRVLSRNGGVVKLDPKNGPNRPVDIVGFSSGDAWVENSEWLYGGVGYSGMIMNTIGYGCCCWNTRYNIDYFERSFAPEVDHYSVAVLDPAGNLILRVGRYGNVDSAGADSKVPLGGDEVGFFHPAYVATHTDRRLFVADPGNGRIVSVKLGYHATATISIGEKKAAK